MTVPPPEFEDTWSILYGFEITDDGFKSITDVVFMTDCDCGERIEAGTPAEIEYILEAEHGGH